MGKNLLTIIDAILQGSEWDAIFTIFSLDKFRNGRSSITLATNPPSQWELWRDEITGHVSTKKWRKNNNEKMMTKIEGQDDVLRRDDSKEMSMEWIPDKHVPIKSFHTCTSRLSQALFPSEEVSHDKECWDNDLVKKSIYYLC